MCVYQDCPYLCLTKKEHHSRYARMRRNTTFVVQEVKKSPKSILKNKDVRKQKSNKKVEIMDNDSCSLGDLLNNIKNLPSLIGLNSHPPILYKTLVDECGINLRICVLIVLLYFSL